MTDAPDAAEPTADPTADPISGSLAPVVNPGDIPPDRLAISPRSPYFNADLLERGIGIRFKGVEKNNVEEYSISEGWIRVQAGKTMDRKGQPLTLKLSGPVEAWYKDLGDTPPVASRG